MGSLEVAGALEPYTDYMIASQEMEPAAGWDYACLSGLAEDQSPVETARRIVDGYMESQALQGETLTLACLDLSHVREVEEALGACFAPLATNMDANSFIALEGQRIRAASFGQPLRDFGDGGYDLVDLADLTDRLETSDDANAAMRKALDSFVVYSRSNRDGANGVSIYHPCYNKDRYMSKWRENYKRLFVSEGYARYVDAFSRFLLGDAMTEWSGLDVAAAPMPEGRQSFTLRLTPEQARNLSSARLLVMMTDQHTPDQGKRQFSLIGTFLAVLGDDNVLTAEYDGKALFLEGAQSIGPLGYFLSPDDHLVTPVTYVPKEGELRMNNLRGISVLTGDGAAIKEYPLGTDTTPNVYYYIADAPDGARIDQVRVQDTATGMLSNRAAFSEEDYRGMVLWYPLKDLPRPNDQGLLPEYVLWDDASAMHGIDMAVPEDWHFAIRQGEQPGSLLWAAFQITDIQQNTCCTLPVAIENPKFTPVPLERDVFESQGTVLSVKATICTASDNPGLWLDFELKKHGTPRSFYICDIVLNGVREYRGSRGSCFLANPESPYEHDLTDAGKGSIFVRAQDLTGMKELDTIRFTLRCMEGYDDSTKTEERLTVKLPKLDISGIAPEMTVLGSAYGAGYTWDVLSIDQDYGNLNLLLRIHHQGKAAFDGDRALAVVNRSIQLAGEGYITLPGPGCEVVLPVSFPSRNLLGWASDHFHMGDTYVDIVTYCLPDLLGNTQIDQIDLALMRFNGGNSPLIPIRLDVPYTPPVKLPDPDDLWTVFHTLGEDDTEPMPLIQGPALEVQIDHLFVGLIGAGISMRVRNLTDHTASLKLNEAWINGRSVSVGRYDTENERIIVSNAETSVVYALGTSDSDQDFWPHTVDALRLSLSCDDEEPVWVELRSVDGPIEPAFGGTELPAEKLKAVLRDP